LLSANSTLWCIFRSMLRSIVSLNLWSIASAIVVAQQEPCTTECAAKKMVFEPVQLPAQPNPPNWGASVSVFRPGDDAAIQEEIARLSAGLTDREKGHFSAERRAFLFAPGTYAVDAEVGYYVQVAGLGRRPEDVIIGGERGIYVDAMDPGQAGSLDTFWRSAENFRHVGQQGFRWAVSQAAPLRRVIVDGDLELFDPTARVNYASGGFLADAVVKGTLVLGSQQQWLARNVELWNGATGGAWSNVFVGCDGAPSEHVVANDAEDEDEPVVDEPRVSVVGATPVVAEKPFVAVNDDGTYVLVVPEILRDVAGAGDAPAAEVSFEDVFVARAGEHDTDDIQTALDAGLHVVLAPGVFDLDAPLKITRPGAVLLGLGLASLVAPDTGEPCVVVDDQGGIRLAGVVLQASKAPTAVLLRWGGPGSSENPSVLSDVFARVGGPGSTDVRADVMAEVSASHVVLDNVWLWRADHSELAPGETPRPGEQYHLVVTGECACDNGLVVDGDDVVAYGLAVEHTERDQLIWNGERGRVFFYQCELPYRRPSGTRRDEVRLG